MAWESWEEHRRRIEAERDRAQKELLCPEEVNEWARYGNDSVKHKICLRKLSPEAVQLGHQVCGLHFRKVRKEEAEAAARAQRAAESRIANERAKVERAVKDAALAAVNARLKDLGVKAEAYERYGWSNKQNGLLSVEMDPLELIALLEPVMRPTLPTPKEAWEAYVAAEEAEKAAKPAAGPAPF